MTFAPKQGTYFWANSYAWGQCKISQTNGKMEVILSAIEGELELEKFRLKDYGLKEFRKLVRIKSGEKLQFIF